MEENKDVITESILVAYISGEASAQQIAQVDAWRVLSPENEKHFRQLEKTWSLSGTLEKEQLLASAPASASSKVNTAAAWAKVAQRIGAVEVQPVQKTKVFTLKTWGRIAALVVILVGTFTLIRLLQSPVEQLQLTAKNEIVSDTLEDGSVISLNKNSTLTYPERFDPDQRLVSLDGEAFFDIAPDKNRPFIIELNEQAKVTVLGTSFNINETDSSTEVFVKTGKVEFASGNEKLILVPGEKGILDLKTGELKKAESASIDYNETYWLDQKLIFDNMPLSEVLPVLEGIFNVSIETTNPALFDCRISTGFEGESLEQILDVIAETLNLKVMVLKNSHYILSGDGC